MLTLRLNDVAEVERNHYLRVKGEGNKERLVPVPRLYRRIERYAQRARPTDTISDRLFLASRRSARTGEYEPLTKSGLEQMVRNLAEVAGIKKRVYPHLLRHSYATWALNCGMNSIMLAQLLGHSSLVMIQRTYAHHTAADTYELLAKVLGVE